MSWSGVGEPGLAVRVEPGERAEQRLAALGDRPVGLGQQVGEQAVLVQHLEGAARAALAQDLVELLEDAGGAAAHDLAAQRADGLDGVGVDREVEPGRERHRAQHAHRVLAEAHGGVADRPDDARRRGPRARRTQSITEKLAMS